MKKGIINNLVAKISNKGRREKEENFKLQTKNKRTFSCFSSSPLCVLFPSDVFSFSPWESLCVFFPRFFLIFLASHVSIAAQL